MIGRRLRWSNAADNVGPGSQVIMPVYQKATVQVDSFTLLQGKQRG